MWSLDEALELYAGGEYTQNKHDAYITFSNGCTINFEREGRLWVIELYGNDYVPPTMEEIGGHVDNHDSEIQALGTRVRAKAQHIHNIQGHSVHDPDCEHCFMDRMRPRARRRVSGPREDQRAGSIYIDLMGPLKLICQALYMK